MPAGRGEAERDYGYLVGVYMLFNRQVNCTRVLLDVTAHSYPSRPQVLSLRVEHSPVSANPHKSSLSAFPPRLSPLSLTFPDPCGHVRDVWEELPRSRFRVGLQASGPGACLWHPVGGHDGVAINFSKRTTTIPHCTYHLENSRA